MRKLEATPQARSQKSKQTALSASKSQNRPRLCLTAYSVNGRPKMLETRHVASLQKSNTTNETNTSSLVPRSPLRVPCYLFKYALSSIGFLAVLGTGVFVPKLALGEVNSPKFKQSTNENIHTVNNKLDRSSKKFSNNNSYDNHKRTALLQDIKLAEAARLDRQASKLLKAGKYREGIPLAEKALAIRQKILGEHLDVASSLNNLAQLYRHQGRYQQAEPLYKQALEMRKRLLGNEHPDVAQSLNNLAQLYLYQGRYQQAQPLVKQALEMRKRLLGNEHPDVAQSLNNLAQLYLYQGRYQQAQPLVKQALEMRKRLLGNEHPDVAQSLNNLALLYESQGRYSEDTVGEILLNI